MRKITIASILLLAVPTVGAALVVSLPAQEEQLVEGHTVFTVVQARPTGDPQREEFAAAVAVLVRENARQITYGERFPGVLWFNDQYLVDPSNSIGSEASFGTRYPCGAVIAVNAGDPLPTANDVPVVPATASYLETYHVTDPNNNAWDVDKWSYDPDADALTANSFLIWSVSVMNDATRHYSPDDGMTDCSSKTDGAGCGIPLLPITDDTTIAGQDLGSEDARYRDNDTEGRDFRDNDSCVGSHTAPSPAIEYSAVLYFFLEDLTDFAGVRNHAVASTDVHGCQVGQSTWPCPAEDDNAEGNSHRYNPSLNDRDETYNWPFKLSDGRNNHGGSTNCGAGNLGGGAQAQHATCNVDVYFGYSAAQRPLVPTYRVFDDEGKTAPYHCHASTTYCNEEDVNPDW